MTAGIQTSCRGGTHQGTGRAGVRGGCGGQVIGSGGKTEPGPGSRAERGENVFFNERAATLKSKHLWCSQLTPSRFGLKTTTRAAVGRLAAMLARNNLSLDDTAAVEPGPTHCNLLESREVIIYP